jgi:hypothetical protein
VSVRACGDTECCHGAGGPCSDGVMGGHELRLPAACYGEAVSDLRQRDEHRTGTAATNARVAAGAHT